MAARGNERRHDDCGHDQRTGSECGAPVFLDTRQAALLLRLSPVTLARWRIQGQGPVYLKAGRRVLYAHADLIVWLDAQRRQRPGHVCLVRSIAETGNECESDTMKE